MKTINLYPFISFLLIMIGFSCKTKTSEKVFISGRTPQTEALFNNLRNISPHHVMFGHQDSPLYGIGWEGDADRSDVKSVVDDYPAVMGFDIGHVELGNEKNIDDVSFGKIREAIIAQYNRGGVVTISWHINNPLTGGDSWDVNTKGTVTSALPDGEKYKLFMQWLQNGADFLKSLKTDEGIKIPIIFRPWHEHTGSWFWWGKKHCTVEEYKQLWYITREVFDREGLDNLLYAYSPSSQGPGEIYMERYPGDAYVDILGFDCYHHGNKNGKETYLRSLDDILSFMTQEGEKRNKPIALSETGLEAIPIVDWWTQVLLSSLEKYPVSYVLVWRNARERPNHYYAPYPEQTSAEDFKKFYQNPRTLFVKDIKQLYQ